MKLLGQTQMIMEGTHRSFCMNLYPFFPNSYLSYVQGSGKEGSDFILKLC